MDAEKRIVAASDGVSALEDSRCRLLAQCAGGDAAQPASKVANAPVVDAFAAAHAVGAIQVSFLLPACFVALL